MGYEGLEAAGALDALHLGGNIRGGDPFTWCPSVWDYVVNRFGIKSVLDFGSGSGTAALYFHRLGMKVCAVDGLEENVRKSIFPTVKHDVTKGPFVSQFDLVHCQEVVEHIRGSIPRSPLKVLLRCPVRAHDARLAGARRLSPRQLATTAILDRSHGRGSRSRFCKRIQRACAILPGVTALRTWRKRGWCSRTRRGFKQLVRPDDGFLHWRCNFLCLSPSISSASSRT